MTCSLFLEINPSDNQEESLVIQDPDGDHETDEPDIVEPKGPEPGMVPLDDENQETEDEEEPEEEEEDIPPGDGDSQDDESGLWEETFKSHHDSKPYGKES